MQDTFWTTELVNEYAGTFLLQAMKAIEAARNGGTVEKIISASEFIASKSPKKEWEIVAFAGSSSGQIYQTLKNGRFALNEHSTSFALEELLASSFPIHSVRRLSDASVWQVKETVEVWETGRFTIQSFEISAGKMLAKTDGGTYLLNALVKLPQAILTTVDQKEVKEGDLVFYVNSDKFISDIWVTKDSFGDDKNPCNVFSTREAAEQYILENKPLLSLNDVKEAIGSNDVFGTLALREKLTALVKEKLNQ